jgi:hypothetical protein
MKRARVFLAVILLLAGSVALAQWRRYSQTRTVREISSDTGEEPPTWKVEPEFARDVFTFARVRYSSQNPRGWARSGGGDWSTDAPDSDINFSFRLQQLTSLRTDPDGRIVELTDPALFDFPWIYIVEPGMLDFTEEEVDALRKYLLNGGFLMVDDFWGDAQWQNFYDQIKRVFPEREPEELPMDHPIFNCVFNLGRMAKNDLQIPNIGDGMRSEFNGGITWERRWGESARDVHIRAIFDAKRRMMVIICHNTDNGDGWEREGISRFYFHEFSEKRGYPLGINIVFYAMTH